MVSTNQSPPIAMPVQVPHGHVVQQIVDENGTLRHVILSPQPYCPATAHYVSNSYFYFYIYSISEKNILKSSNLNIINLSYNF